MKKISNTKMSSLNGGAKCIYHYMLAAATLSPLFVVNLFGNYSAVGECWNNSHVE